MQDANYSAEIIAKFLNLTTTRIRQMVADGMPKVGRNQYPLVACTHWYIKFLKSLAKSPDTTTIKEEKRRLTKEKADAEELKNQQTRKELIPAADVGRAWSDMIIKAKTKLLALPSKIAPIAAELDDPRKVQIAVKALVYEALEELGDSGKPRNKRKPRKVVSTS